MVGPSLELLIIDPNADDRELAAAVLRDALENVQIHFATECADLSAVLRQRFDLVVTEFDLPCAQGVEVLEALRLQGVESPIVAFTDRDVLADAVEGMRRGLADYVQKSAHGFLQLPEVVRRALKKRKQTELAAQPQTSAMRLIEGAGFGIFRSTLDDRILEASVACLDILGVRSLEDAFEIDWSCLIRSQGRSDLYAEVDDQGLLSSRLVELDKPSGGRLAARVTEQLLVDSEGETVIEGLIEDVSSKVASEARLTQRLEALRVANRGLEQFAAVVSHELQEPLRTAEQYVRLFAQDHFDQVDSESREDLMLAIDGVVQARGLVQDLLAFSRLGTEPLELRAVDVAEVLERVLSDLTRLVQETRARVRNGDLPTVSCDSQLLELVLRNLLSNAIKFRGDVPPEIEVTGRREAEYWVLSVSDNGVGIAAQFVPDVFSMFRRFYPERHGAGLGLAISKRAVELHGGKVWCESTPGSGSTFHFSLPAVPSSAEVN